MPKQQVTKPLYEVLIRRADGHETLLRVHAADELLPPPRQRSTAAYLSPRGQRHLDCPSSPLRADGRRRWRARSGCWALTHQPRGPDNPTMKILDSASGFHSAINRFPR
jgi:hypothetical protein